MLWVAGTCVCAQDVPRAAAKRRGELRIDSLAAARAAEVALWDSLQATLPPDSLATLVKQAAQATDSLDRLALQAQDSLMRHVADSIAAENLRQLEALTTPATPEVDLAMTDSLVAGQQKKVFVPNPTTATWLALVIPGGGQIYNRKFWKLPIIYGGFAGCAYALTWNNNMYKDYSDAYRDAVNENWDSSSIQDLLPTGYLKRVSTTQLTEVLRTRKNRYRRYRDLSIFAFIGVYLLSVVDAYVDAELSNFDISPDLSMSVEPTVIDNNSHKKSGKSAGKSVGLQCSLKF